QMTDREWEAWERGEPERMRQAAWDRDYARDQAVLREREAKEREQRERDREREREREQMQILREREREREMREKERELQMREREKEMRSRDGDVRDGSTRNPAIIIGPGVPPPTSAS